jgi:hypothetical protein
VNFYASIAERVELIAGLRALAKFLEENEEVPAPRTAEVFVFPEDSTDDEQREEIDNIATRIGAIPSKGAGGHYKALRKFGPVEYRAVAIPAKSDEEW